MGGLPGTFRVETYAMHDNLEGAELRERSAASNRLAWIVLAMVVVVILVRYGMPFVVYHLRPGGHGPDIRTRHYVRQIHGTLRAYQMEYRRLPDWGGGEPIRFTEEHARMLEGWHGYELNPRRIRFIEIPDYFRQDGHVVDIWGHPIWMVLDTEGRGEVRVGDRIVPHRVAVSSVGPNGRNDWGRRDDITSW